MATKRHSRRLCPVTAARLALVQRLIAGKWKLVILWQLSEGTNRFGELQRKLPHISQAILAQQLRELEHDRLIHREVYKEIPLKVEYSLTNVGQSIVPILIDVYKWIINYNKNIIRPAAFNIKKMNSVEKISNNLSDNAGNCHCGDYCTCGSSCSCNSQMLS